MGDSRVRLGRKGESLARQYLEQSGLIFLGANIRTPYGEIDLLVKEGDTLVFVEVKTRRSKRYGAPEEAITARKLQKMVDSALAYLQSQNDPEANWRLDVVSVFLPEGESPALIEHIPGVRL
ncbi:MAG: YraN family protein [Chloroflexi bacterium]|nr:YraN family protein [Chloroflexota bacterium]